jgi:hypothetical protein
MFGKRDVEAFSQNFNLVLELLKGVSECRYGIRFLGPVEVYPCIPFYTRGGITHFQAESRRLLDTTTPRTVNARYIANG